ncbi:tyrosyl-DNA phosphodiesterase 1 [Strigomonas culicis]|uniref:Tyrosyl-DNA phosphodiesterase 1 n=1 Tax=Strigomonas culicis TaxID=28005 RepID=S9UR00_9TRYP|nr:tyrosyl-DNA phosphodiesterase 1 [Strigomonas culicis]|eukprot:EPY31194.1 tyrosyl-DNA phosphodiesterase 1 [Strigomonas culicis]
MSVPLWNNRVSHTDAGTGASGDCCVTLNDVLGCDTTKPEELWDHVLLGSYLLDITWLLRAVECLRQVGTSFVVVSGEKDSGTHLLKKQQDGTDKWVAQSEALKRVNPIVHAAKLQLKECSTFSVVEPRLPYPYGTHHSKFALCVNKNGLRVAIFTSNLVESDWRLKHQGIYCQDFPLKVGTQPRDSPRGHAFSSYLCQYLRQYGFCNATANYMDHAPLSFFGSAFLDRYDFTDAKVYLVASIPGVHDGIRSCPGDDDHAYFGLHRIAQVVKHCVPSMERAAPPILSWQYTSQGTLTDSFLEKVCAAMSGTRCATDHGKVSFPQVQVVYPTEDEVKQSIEGWRSGFSIPVRMRCWHTFLNTRLCRWGHRSTARSAPCRALVAHEGGESDETVASFLRPKGMPHMKTYAAVHPDRSGLFWLLLTSANLSQAAWGSPQGGGGRSTASPARLLIRSYELGVLYDYTSSIELSSVFSITPSAASKMAAALSVVDPELYEASLVSTHHESSVVRSARNTSYSIHYTSYTREPELVVGGESVC